MTLPWGVAYTGDVWLGDPIDLIDAHFTDRRRPPRRLRARRLSPSGARDMAFDTARNLIWQVNVGGDNGIYGLDPADGSVVQ